MPCEIFSVQQAILRGGPSDLPVVVCDQSSLTEQVLQDFLQTVQNGIIGVAPAFGTHCALQTLAFASSTQILLVKLPSKHKHGSKDTSSRRLASLVNMLCNPAYTRYALHPERIAAALFFDLGLKAGTFVDLWSLAHKQPTDYAFLCTVLGQQNILRSARNVYKDEKRESGLPKRAALRAWLSCHIGSAHTRRSSACPMLDLSLLPEMVCALSFDGIHRSPEFLPVGPSTTVQTTS